MLVCYPNLNFAECANEEGALVQGVASGRPQQPGTPGLLPHTQAPKEGVTTRCLAFFRRRKSMSMPPVLIYKMGAQLG